MQPLCTKVGKSAERGSGEDTMPVFLTKVDLSHYVGRSVANVGSALSTSFTYNITYQ
ncbi:hypothetical protein NX413_004249 [Salmonella enterica]|nr:hypothetical protein [Salmonella enterica]EJR4404720.1 hypothetical protein [Salmonella enterica]